MKFLKQSEPISDSVPRNTFVLTVEVMHGDADQYTTESYSYSKDDERGLGEMVKLVYAVFNMRDGAHETTLVEQELAEVGKDFKMEYPSDMYIDLVGYDVTTNGNFLAVPEKLSIVWYDSMGVKYPVDIELDDGTVLKTISMYTLRR